MKIAIPKNRTELKQHLGDSLFKNSYFIMLNSFSTSIMGFIFWIVVARYYTPHNVGLASAIFSAAGLVNAFSGLGLAYGLIRYLPQEADKQGMINSCLSITGFLSFVFGTIFIIGLDIWSPALLFVRENNLFLFSFVIFVVVSGMFALQNNIFIAMRFAKYSLFQNLINNILRVLFPIILISFGVFGIVFSWLIAVVVAFIIGTFFFIPRVLPGYKPIPTIKKEIINKMMHFSLGNHIAGFLGSLPIMVMPLMIVNVLGAEMAAYFYMAYSVAATLPVISGAVTTSLFTEGSHDQENFRLNVIRSIKFILLLLIPAIIGLFLFGDKILLLFGKTYSKNATALLWLFGISSIPLAINQLYMTVKRVQIDIKPIIYINSFITFFIIGGSYLLMSEIGLIGIGIAWVLGHGIAALTVGFFVITKERWVKI